MLIITNKRYIKRHVVGGAGIFDSVSGFLKRFLSTNAAQSLAKAAASDVGKAAIIAAKTASKELATTAITTAIEKGKRVIKNKISSNDQTPVITQQNKDILAGLINIGVNDTTNINRLLAGQGIKQHGAIRIEDLVKQINGGGLRLA